MLINIFILCYNERILIPFTVRHYKNIFPDCVITIYDNESSDDSVEISKSLGCNVISWSSNKENNVFMKANISNNCWKNVKDGWVIVIDMDEWLCISEELLIKEQENGTTILSTQGIEMIGESTSIIVDDIDLNKIDRGMIFDPESKCVCFFKPKIKEMNYNLGCHKCNPIGCIKFSSNIYIIKHFALLGIPFYVNKIANRKQRSKRLIQEMGISPQYNRSKEEVTRDYLSKFNFSFPIVNLKKDGYFLE
jgi:hypothetical protein